MEMGKNLRTLQRAGFLLVLRWVFFFGFFFVGLLFPLQYIMTS